MTDPTNDQLLVPDPSFMDDYDFGGQYTPPPQAKVPDPKRPGKFIYNIFVAQAPELKNIQTRDDQGRFLRTKPQNGKNPSLKMILRDIKLVESGYLVQQTHVSAAQYQKYKNGQPTGELRNASQFLDYLHSHGIDVKPATPDEYEAYAQATADRQFEVRGNWSAYDKDSQSDVASSWEDFPDDPDNPGQKLPYIERDGKRFWARLSITGFVNKVEREK